MLWKCTTQLPYRKKVTKRRFTGHWPLPSDIDHTSPSLGISTVHITAIGIKNDVRTIMHHQLVTCAACSATTNQFHCLTALRWMWWTEEISQTGSCCLGPSQNKATIIPFSCINGEKQNSGLNVNPEKRQYRKGYPKGLYRMGTSREMQNLASYKAESKSLIKRRQIFLDCLQAERLHSGLQQLVIAEITQVVTPFVTQDIWA